MLVPLTGLVVLTSITAQSIDDAATLAVRTVVEGNAAIPYRRPGAAGVYEERLNRTFLSWMGRGYQPHVIAYKHDRNPFGLPKCVGTTPFVDPHNYPMLVQTHDGHLHLFYGAHNTTLR